MSPWERGAYGRTETPEQAEAMAAMFRSGTRAVDIARAFDIPVRTVYRAIRRADRAHIWVEIGDWRAQFAMTDVGPVQVRGWLPSGRSSGTSPYHLRNATPDDGGVQSPHQRSHHEHSPRRTPDDVQRNRDAVASRGTVRGDA